MTLNCEICNISIIGGQMRKVSATKKLKVIEIKGRFIVVEKRALKEIALVASAGVIRSEDLKVDVYDKEVVLLTGNNVSELGILFLEEGGDEKNIKKVFVEEKTFLEKKLEAGDIVFISRGAHFRAAIVREEDLRFDLLPSPNFLVIKVNPEQSAEVIVAYLNSFIGQQQLNHIAVGASLRNIPVGKLKDFNIPYLSQEKQSALNTLFYKNIAALESILALYTQQQRVFNAVISNLVEE